MLRRLIDKERSAARGALHAVREWIHPTKVMKQHAFDRPLDDLGQTIDDVEHRADAQETGPAGRAPRA